MANKLLVTRKRTTSPLVLYGLTPFKPTMNLLAL